MLNASRYWLYGLLGVVFMLLVGCGATPSNGALEPYTQVAGVYRVALSTTPVALRVGQPVTLIVSIQESSSGIASTNLIVRPILDMDMADGMGMTLPNLDAQEVEQGVFHINTIIDHAGDVTLSLTLDTPDGLVPVRFPSLPVTP